jgi:phenylalanyl-tRNA synthetase beta chain
MKISYNELQKSYFNGTLPSKDALVEALTFHSWEVDGIENYAIDSENPDTVLDIKVLPDKSAWALSHRGIAKDISAVLDLPLAHDPLEEAPVLEPVASELSVSVATPTCTRYTAAVITGVKVGPSPEWLVAFLASMGQRSINNVVDITNYVMFGVGQPLHAFDAAKLSHDGGWKIVVRDAREGERITTLTGEEYALTTGQDALIVDGGTDQAVGIAGIKGGKAAEVDGATVDIILESANFDPVRVRKTSQRLKLRTDASARFENGISRSMAAYGVKQGAELIVKFCGGSIAGYIDTNPEPVVRPPVSLSVAKANGVLGLSLTMDDVEGIVKRFGYEYEISGDTITVTPPHERPDLVIPEDVIEEIGRIHGYEHVPSIAIAPQPLREVNVRFFYAEAVRDALIAEGFTEVFTSSFRSSDDVKLKNALASDKGFLRSEKGMMENMREALEKNAPMADLFGAEQVRIFEIGTSFAHDGERLMLTLGASSKQGFVPKKDQKTIDAAVAAVTAVLGTMQWSGEGAVRAADIGTAISILPRPIEYRIHALSSEVSYKPFSHYPYLTRDVAFWTPIATESHEAECVIRDAAGENVARIDMFDRFEKEGRVSYGFRIVFQSYEKTLDGAEADAYMQSVYDALRAQGYEVR